MNKYEIGCLTVFFLIFTICKAEKIKQCTCDSIQPCKKSYSDNLFSCFDTCELSFFGVGVNYPALKICIETQQSKLKATLKCVEDLYGKACAATPGNMVEKRYIETTRVAILMEIESILKQNAIADKVKPILDEGKKFSSCVNTCLNKKTHHCATKLGCGLDLPSDNALVQSSKSCAINSGFNTPTIREFCHCALEAGIKHLDGGVCDKITVN